MARQKWLYHISTGIAVGIALAGCTGFKDPSPKNFTGALNAYYVTTTIACSKVRFSFLTKQARRKKIPRSRAWMPWRPQD